MAKMLSIGFGSRASLSPPLPTSPRQSPLSRYAPPSLIVARQRVHSCNGARITCLFRDNKEQARKALENALDGKLGGEFEKWNRELTKKEEELESKGGFGGGGGKGGWFRWWGGGGRDEHFWHEAQQTGLTVLAIVAMYVLIAKGDVLLATIVNPSLYALRRVRLVLTLATSEMMKRISPATHARLQSAQKEQVQHATAGFSAKEKVLKKWG